jgi:hypothetical protein
MRLADIYAKGVVAIALYVVAANSPVAHGDIGGVVPGPGLCDYPGIGGSGMVMSTYYYWCDFPTEGNGSHWHCEYGGAAVVATGGVSILMFQASISGNVGAVGGSCSWRCPDNTLSAAPNPPGAWKASMNPAKCVPVGAAPPPPGAPAVIVDNGPAPAVTNPDNPNPDATQNPPR